MEPDPNKANYLPAALSDTMASERLTDVVTTAADIGLDALVSSGAFDGVPIFGALVGMWRAGTAVRDHLFTKKVAAFLITFEQTPEDVRKAFIAGLERAGKKAMFGEQLLLLIDRMDDLEKPHIVARVMSAAASGHIPLNKAMRLAKIVDRAYTEDLQLLRDFKSGVQPDQVIADSLFSIGLLTSGGSDEGTFAEAGSGGTIYHINDFGRLLVKHGLEGT